MKRTLVVLLGILLLAVALGWGIWTYRQYDSYHTPIPRNATLVVKANVDALLKDIAWNALWNGDYYDSIRDGDRPRLDRKGLKRLGVSIPANVFLYQIAELESYYFGTLEVSDTAALRHFLSDELGMDTATHQTGTLWHSSHAMVSLTEHRVAFAITTSTNQPIDTAQVSAALAGIVNETDMVAVKESDFNALRALNGQLTFMGDGFSGSIQGKNGSMVFSAQVEATLPDTMLQRPDFPADNAASLWLNLGLDGLLKQRNYRIGPYSLSGDSLLKHYQNALAVEWKGVTTQHDTTVAYDYNDDFELVEKTELVEKQVPALYFTIHSDADGLVHYLREQGFLNATGDGINRDAFPLYQVNVSRITPTMLQFHTTDASANLRTTPHGGYEAFYLEIDLQKIATQEPSALLTRYLQPFDHVKAVGHAVEPNQVAIQGTLSMKNPQINSFAQLFSLLNPKN